MVLFLGCPYTLWHNLEYLYVKPIIMDHNKTVANSTSSSISICSPARSIKETIILDTSDKVARIEEKTPTIYLSSPASAPSVILEEPNGNQYISSDHNISFYVKDQDSNMLWISIYYSSTPEAFSNTIIEDANILDASLFTCADSDFSDYTLCTYSWDTNAVIDGNYYIDINVYDADAQFDTDSSDSSFMVDNTAPSTTDNAPEGWQSQPFTVTFTCSDGTGSGCYQTYYRIDNGNWQIGTSVTISEDGNHRIQYYSVDRAGVPEPVKTCYAALRAGAHTFTIGLILDGNYRNYSLYVADLIDGETVDSVATQTITSGTNIDYASFEGDGNMFALVSTGACHELSITNVSPNVFNMYMTHSWRPEYGKEFFLVFTRGNHYDIEKNRKAITNGTFLKRVQAVFGYEAKSDYELILGLDYYNTSIDINADLHLGPGYHTLIVENQGTVNDRVVISIERS